MNFIVNEFTYNGISSSTYGLRFARVETDTPSEVGGKKEYITQFIKRGHRNSIVAARYNEDSCLTFEMEIFSDQTLDESVCDEICSWLFDESTYGTLTIDDYSSKYQGVFFKCVMTEANEMRAIVDGKERVFGYRFTVKCNAPWGWRKVTKHFSKNLNDIEVKVRGAVKDYTYPTVTIMSGISGGDISIKNKSDNDRLTTFVDLSPSSQIIMKPDNCELTGAGTTGLWEKFKSKRFLRLVRGTNDIEIEGDVDSVALEYLEAVYI